MVKQRSFLVPIVVLVMVISSPFYARGSAQKVFAKGAPQESLILDNIEDGFHANIRGFVEGFRCVTFVRQEYPTGKWIYHVIFTNSKPKTFVRNYGSYNFTFPTPNVNFTVSRDLVIMNRLSYSTPNLTISAFTVVQTTFETEDFLEVPPK